MYCRLEKSYGSELVTQMFMMLGYIYFSISVLPVVYVAISMTTVLAKEYQVNSCLNHRIVISP